MTLEQQANQVWIQFNTKLAKTPKTNAAYKETMRRCKEQRIKEDADAALELKIKRIARAGAMRIAHR